MNQLAVYYNDTPAGLLVEHKRGLEYSFQYYDEYLKSDLPPISVTMPKREEAYFSKYLFPLFTNMLPEGGNKNMICRWNKIDEEDSWSLLVHMADKDVIGAVNVRTL